MNVNRLKMTFLAMGAILLFSTSAWADAGMERYDTTPSHRMNRWTGGGGIGFLSETPDDTAFTVNLFGDYFLDDHVSIGPLAQLAFTGDLAQYAISGQGKYWMPVPGTNDRTNVVFQAGVGIVHAAFQLDDTSWIVPLGIGVDQALSDAVSVYANFMLNLTDLNTGRGTDADVMPGVTFGARF